MLVDRFGRSCLLDVFTPPLDPDPSGLFPWRQPDVATVARSFRKWGDVFDTAERLGCLTSAQPEPWTSDLLPVRFCGPDPFPAAVLEAETLDWYATVGFQEPPETPELVAMLCDQFPVDVPEPVPLLSLLTAARGKSSSPTPRPAVLLHAVAGWLEHLARQHPTWVLRPSNLHPADLTNRDVWLIAPNWVYLEAAVRDEVHQQWRNLEVTLSAMMGARWTAVVEIAYERRHRAKVDPQPILDWVLSPGEGAVRPDTYQRLKARCRGDIASGVLWASCANSKPQPFTVQLDRMLQAAGSQPIPQTRFLDEVALAVQSKPGRLMPDGEAS